MNRARHQRRRTFPTARRTSRAATALRNGAFLGLLATAAHAQTPDVASGVGGGGYLTAGAFHPESAQQNWNAPNIMVVGGDVCGIYRTTDFGQSWVEWNQGLENADEGASYYVEDIVGVPTGDVSFTSATRGGLYTAPYGAISGAQPWVRVTKPEEGFAYEHADRDVEVIPFACVDWNRRTNPSLSVVVAGAGRIRWNSSTENDYYPGLAPDKFVPYDKPWHDVHVTAQWTVWKLTVDGWRPDVCSTHMGPARDIAAIKAAKQGNTSQYIAVAARAGVFLKRDDNAWLYLGVPPDLALDSAWSVALTTDGNLYGAFASKRLLPEGPSVRGGVYRIANIGALPVFGGCGVGLPNPPWQLIGDPAAMISQNTEPPSYIPLDEVLMHENPIYLTVHDPGQNSTNPEVLYLATRGGLSPGGLEGGQPRRQGLYRAAVLETTQPHLVEWKHLLYATSNGTSYMWWPPSFTSGWEDHTGPFVLFQPLVYSPTSGPPLGAPRVALQVGTRFHTSSSADVIPPVWNQRYTNSVASGTWRTRGYNELVVGGIDFMSDGRVVYGNGDMGVFRGIDTANSAFEWMKPPLDRDQNETPCGYAESLESLYVHPQQNWLGSGREWVLIANGNVIHRRKPGRMFAVDGDTWHEMTCNLAERDHYLFEDFIVVGGEIYVTYTKFGQTVGTPNALFVEAGVLKGTKVHHPGLPDYATPGDWTWTPMNAGLADLNGHNPRPTAILYNIPANKFFLSACMETLRPGAADVTQPTDVNGGVFWLGASGTWTKVFPTVSGTGSTYLDFRSLAQSSDGSMLYAGTRGRSVGDGLVIRCGALQATSASSWAALSNGLTFGFQIPYHKVGAPGWTQSYAGYEFTEVWSLAVDPFDPDVVYAGLHSTGAFPQEGVWRCDASTLSWSQQPPGAAKKGMGVLGLGFRPTDPTKLFVGTQGQDLHIFDVSGN